MPRMTNSQLKVALHKAEKKIAELAEVEKTYVNMHKEIQILQTNINIANQEVSELGQTLQIQDNEIHHLNTSLDQASNDIDIAWKVMAKLSQ